jgi:hypothetical protein
MPKEPMKFEEMLKDSPKNWGRWGANDELGCLNFLTNEEVLRGVKAVRQGKTFTLGIPLARPQGDPLYPSRSQPIRTMVSDKGMYMSANSRFRRFGVCRRCDRHVPARRTTQYDALGRVWYGDKIITRREDDDRGLQKCSIGRSRTRGDRSVSSSTSRARKQEARDRTNRSVADLEAAAKKQNSPIEARSCSSTPAG